MRSRRSYQNGFLSLLCALTLTPSIFAAPKRVTLRATKGVPEVRASYEDGKLFAENCKKGPCSERVEVDIPKDVDRLDFHSETIRLKDDQQLLHIWFGKERSFHVLLAPSTEGAPRLVLRGYSGGPKDAKIELSEPTPKPATLYVTRPATRTLCGRKLLTSVKRYDSSSGEFVDARLSPLSSAERKAATELSSEKLLQPLLTDGHWALTLRSSSSSDDAAGLFDASFGPSATLPWVSAEIDASGLDALVLHKKRHSGASSFYLVVGERVFQLNLPEDDGAYRVALPERSPGECVGLVDEGKSEALVEVSGLVPQPEPASALTFLRALEGEQREYALRALALMVNSPEQDLVFAGAFPKLSSAERVALLHAIADARDFVLPFTVEKALSSGTPSESERAERILEARAPTSGAVLKEAFDKSAVADEARFARILRDYAPSYFFESVLPRLEEKSAARRSKLRDLLSGALRNPTLVAELRGHLTAAKTSRAVKVELLRGLGPRASELRPESAQALESLLRKDSFFDQMKVLSAWLSLLPHDESLRTALASRIDKQSGLEQAALLTGIFEMASERDLEPTTLHFVSGLALRAVQHSEMRVRRSALFLLAKSPGEESRAPIQNLASSDPWPAVREAALTALASGTVDSAFIQERLSSDEAPRVRAVAARSLEKANDESSLKALREALDDDESSLVRAKAAETLGRRCDVGSLPKLTELTRKLVERGASEAELDVAWGALSALVSLAPKDLEERVAPLVGANVPGPLRGQIRMILSRGSHHSCAVKAPSAGR